MSGCPEKPVVELQRSYFGHAAYVVRCKDELRDEDDLAAELQDRSYPHEPLHVNISQSKILGLMIPCRTWRISWRIWMPRRRPKLPAWSQQPRSPRVALVKLLGLHFSVNCDGNMVTYSRTGLRSTSEDLAAIAGHAQQDDRFVRSDLSKTFEKCATDAEDEPMGCSRAPSLTESVIPDTYVEESCPSPPPRASLPRKQQQMEPAPPKKDRSGIWCESHVGFGWTG